ncbi:MAG: VWA domain-containing protein [Polyangiaceae bacterium]
MRRMNPVTRILLLPAIVLTAGSLLSGCALKDQGAPTSENEEARPNVARTEQRESKDDDGESGFGAEDNRAPLEAESDAKSGGTGTRKRDGSKAPSRAPSMAPRPAPAASAAAAPDHRMREQGIRKSKRRARAPGGRGFGSGHGRLGGVVGQSPRRISKPQIAVPTDDGLLRERADRFGDMYFRHYGVNPTIDTAEQPRSTFSVDVDTASYTMTRSFLQRGRMPAEAAVRVEEVINAFDYAYQAPTGETFSVHAEAAPSPSRKGYHVLHVGVQGKKVAASERKASNLVFVVDVSGSMSGDNRLGLVKRSLGLLTEQLRENDTVAIVAYGTNARQVLAPTSAYNKQRILAAVHSLRTEGATNAEAGIRLGYKIAASAMKPGGVNRVILCSDGVANTGLTGAGGILDTVHREAKRGITISTIGFGMGNYNDVLMEKLAQGGNGNYHYVDKLAQARRVFVENLTGTLQVIAKDVKLQMAFDPAVVSRYRLIGYENRKLKARDFSNDRVDAGEIGAGHAVTALYEVKLRDGATGDLGKIRIRYKEPQGNTSKLIEKTLARSMVRGSTDALTSPSQLSLVAGQFAEKLRGSYWARTVSYADMLARFERVAPELRNQAKVRELRKLIERAQKLDPRKDKFEKDAPVAMMTFDKVPILR